MVANANGECGCGCDSGTGWRRGVQLRCEKIRARLSHSVNDLREEIANGLGTAVPCRRCGCTPIEVDTKYRRRMEGMDRRLDFGDKRSGCSRFMHITTWSGRRHSTNNELYESTRRRKCTQRAHLRCNKISRAVLLQSASACYARCRQPMRDCYETSF